MGATFRVLSYAVAFAFFSQLLSCTAGNGNTAAADNTANESLAPAAKKGKVIEKENTPTRPTTLAESNIAGKVKYLSYRTYSVRGRGRKVLKTKGFYSYNADGYLLCHNEHSADGTETINCLYDYNRHNLPTEWTVMDKAMERNSRIAFRYDSKGNIREEIIQDDDPKLSVRSVYRYDTGGNAVEEKDYNADGRLMWVITWKYDAKGNQVEMAYHSVPDNVVHSKITCVYDEHGSVTEGKRYALAADVIAKWTCKNNDAGRCTEKIYYTPDGTVTMRNTFSYDGHGNVTEYNYYLANGSFNEDYSYSQEYVYDKAGNIVKQTRFVRRAGKKVPSGYTEFDIQYY